MKSLNHQYPITDCCEALGVSRSGYYEWMERKPCPRAAANTTLIAQIEEVFHHRKCCYGSPRITHELRKRGYECSENRVARLMHEKGLNATPTRRFRIMTTDSNHDLPIAPNRLATTTEIIRTDQVWVSDITYVSTDEGWLYVAGILDAYSRRVVGWAMGDSLATDLPLDALKMALQQRRPSDGLLHHSDRGCQYASDRYREHLAAASVTPSMSRPGNCYDNAMMESFWASLKRELVHRVRFRTRAEAYRMIFEYIEVFYNRERIHSSLGYQSPVSWCDQTFPSCVKISLCALNLSFLCVKISFWWVSGY
jgi:putative transposase